MRRQIPILVLTALFPFLIAFVCSYLLSGRPIVKVVYAVAKTAQLGLPLLWVVAFERRTPRFGRPRLGSLVVGFISGAALCTAMLVIYGLGFRAELLASDAPAVLRTKLGGYGIHTPGAFVGFAAYHAILNTLAEEYYWRWFFLARVRQLASPVVAILVSSLAFTVHHGFAVYWNGGTGLQLVSVACSIAVCAAVWSWLYERYGELYTPWISHVVVELGLLLMAYDLWRP